MFKSIVDQALLKIYISTHPNVKYVVEWVRRMYLLDWAIELLMASVHFVKLPGLFQNDPQKSPQYCPIFNAHVWPQKSPNISQFSHVCSQRRPVNFPRWQQPLTTGAGGKKWKVSNSSVIRSEREDESTSWVSRYTWLDWLPKHDRFSLNCVEHNVY